MLGMAGDGELRSAKRRARPGLCATFKRKSSSQSSSACEGVCDTELGEGGRREAPTGTPGEEPFVRWRGGVLVAGRVRGVWGLLCRVLIVPSKLSV